MIYHQDRVWKKVKVAFRFIVNELISSSNERTLFIQKWLSKLIFNWFQFWIKTSVRDSKLIKYWIKELNKKKKRKEKSRQMSCIMSLVAMQHYPE